MKLGKATLTFATVITLCATLAAATPSQAASSTYDKDINGYKSVSEAKALLVKLQTEMRTAYKVYTSTNKDGAQPAISAGANAWPWPQNTDHPKIAFSTPGRHTSIDGKGATGNWNTRQNKFYFEVRTFTNKHWVKSDTTKSCTYTKYGTMCSDQFHPAHWEADITIWAISNGSPKPFRK